MKENGTLQVLYDGKVVGKLALMAGRKIAFEYSEEWLETGFSISPFSLPLKEQVFIPTKEYFGGLFGVFGDSLPDGWGNLLLNRMLRKKGMKPEEMTMLWDSPEWEHWHIGRRNIFLLSRRDMI